MYVEIEMSKKLARVRYKKEVVICENFAAACECVGTQFFGWCAITTVNSIFALSTHGRTKRMFDV